MFLTLEIKCGSLSSRKNKINIIHKNADNVPDEIIICTVPHLKVNLKYLKHHHIF